MGGLADTAEKFKLFKPVTDSALSTSVADTRRVLTWNMARGQEDAKDCLAAKVYQDPDLKDGSVEVSGCASLRSSHLQIIPLDAREKWKLGSLGAKNAYPQADGC